MRAFHYSGLCWLIVCTMAVWADPPARPLARRPERILDVALSPEATLEGYLIDPFGKVLKEMPVRLVHNRKVIWTGRTNAEGHFQVQGLPCGVYQVDSDRLSANCRVWTPEAAPPRASRSLLLTRDLTSKDSASPVIDDLTIRVSGFPSLMFPRMMTRDIRKLMNP